MKGSRRISVRPDGKPTTTFAAADPGPSASTTTSRAEPITLREFAEDHSVQVRRDACGEQVIAGRVGHVYQHSSGGFGVLLMLATPRSWTHAQRKLTDAGFTIRQDGDTEGTALFHPGNPAQARLALKLAGARPKRALSASERQRLAAAGRASRFGATTALEGRMGR